MGGLNADGSFSENSLSRYYSFSIGISYDTRRYLNYIYAGKDPDFPIIFKDTELIDLANLVFYALSSLLFSFSSHLMHKKKIKLESIIKDPERLARIISGFLEKCLNFTAGYNAGTFFIWSMRKNTRKFINTAYKGLKNEENFENTLKWLGLEKLYVPQIKDPYQYTVWGIPITETTLTLKARKMLSRY